MAAPDALAGLILTARHALVAAAQRIPDAAFHAIPPGESWTPAELIAHVVAVDYFYLAEALATCASPGRRFSYFDDTAWRALYASTAPPSRDELMANLARSHALVVHATRCLSAAELRNPAVHPRGIPYDVAAILARFHTHDVAHTAQLLAMQSGVGTRK